MLSILTAVLGFAGPFVPEVLRWMRDKDDKKHELAMMDKQVAMAEREHQFRLAEIDALADVKEAEQLRKPQRSYGVQLIDAADKWAETTWGKCLISPAFYAYVLLDVLNSIVRPAVTLLVIGFYVAYKWALLKQAGGNVLAVWGENDWAVVTLVLGFWFGGRMAKEAFGGNAKTGYRGG